MALTKEEHNKKCAATGDAGLADCLKKCKQLAAKGVDEEKCADGCEDLRDSEVDRCEENYAEDLTQSLKEEIAPEWQKALKTVSGCAKKLSDAQWKLVLLLSDIYIENARLFNSSLEKSANSMHAMASNQREELISKGKPALVKQKETIQSLQRVCSVWPENALDPNSDDEKMYSVMWRLYTDDTDVMSLPDFPGIDEDAEKLDLELEFKSAQAAPTLFGGMKLNLDLTKPPRASSYPVGWGSLFGVILAQCEALARSEKTLIRRSAIDGLAGTSEEGGEKKGAAASYHEITAANHDVIAVSTHDDVDVTINEIGESTNIQPQTILDIMKWGGNGFFFQKEFNFSPLKLLSGLTNSGNLLSTLVRGWGEAAQGNTPAADIGAWLISVAAELTEVLSVIEKNSQCIFDADMEFRKKTKEAAEKIKDEVDPNWFSEVMGATIDEDFQQALDDLDADPEAFVGRDNLFVSKVLFKEQCWLLAYIDLLARYKYQLDIGTGENGTALKHLPYRSMGVNKRQDRNANATLLVDGDPYAFINRITASPFNSFLFDMSNHELSNLQPQIRLFKVVYDEEGQDLKEVPIAFDTYFNNSPGVQLTNVLGDRTRRGSGVGIKNFTFAYEANNPFALKKSISANLKIFAANIKDLFEPRANANGGEEYRYVDLALKTAKTSLNKNNDGEACFDHIEANTDLYPLNFRLKALIGLSEPPAALSGITDGNLRQALRESYVTLNLTPTVHNFELDDMGRVIFNINYLAYIEEMFDQSAYNIFANAHIGIGGVTRSVALNRLKREFEIKTLTKKCGGSQADTLKEEYEDEIAAETSESISQLIGSLMSASQIHYITLTTEEIASFSNDGPNAARKSLRQRLETQIKGAGKKGAQGGGVCGKGAAPTEGGLISSSNEMLAGDLSERVSDGLAAFEEAYGEDADLQAEITKALVSGANPKSHVLSYFYVSDLIDIILENIDKELDGMPKQLTSIVGGEITAEQIEEKKNQYRQYQAHFKKMRILLGPAELQTDKRQTINLGDIPVSVKYFIEWMTDKMLKKQEVFYPLTKFINDLFNNFIKNFLNNSSCFGVDIKQKTRLSQAALTAFTPEPNVDAFTRKGIQHLIPRLPIGGPGGEFVFPKTERILNLSGPSQSERVFISSANEINYMAFFAGRVKPMDLMTGDRDADRTRGIFHYVLGRDRGIIKNIKLSKTQTPGLAEVRFEQTGYDGLAQLKVVYNVQIDTFANVQTFPGTYIYVDPRGFSPDGVSIPNSPLNLTDLGLGGYYMIIKSEHEFGEGYANTSIQAQFVNELEHKEAKKDCEVLKDSSAGSGLRKNPACDRKEAAS